MGAVVMYHYVRDTEGTDFPGIHARSLREFEFQLNHFESNFEVASIKNFDIGRQETVLLSFDDGKTLHQRIPSTEKKGIFCVIFCFITTPRQASFVGCAQNSASPW